MKMKRDKEHKQFPQYIAELQAKGQYWFVGAQIQQEMGLSKGALRLALYRLMKKQGICRIRNDFYVIVPLEHQIAGCIPALWFIDAFMKYLDLSYYVAMLSAASLEGAAHQQVMALQIITTKPQRPIIAGNQRINFYYKQKLPTANLIDKKTPLSYCKVSNPELTACDLVRYINSSGQLHSVATVLYELAEKLNVDMLIQLLDKKFVLLSVMQRLGYILENIRAPLSLDTLALAITERNPRYIHLIDNQKKIIRKEPRWHILVDDLIEIDEL